MRKQVLKFLLTTALVAAMGASEVSSTYLEPIPPLRGVSLVLMNNDEKNLQPMVGELRRIEVSKNTPLKGGITEAISDNAMSNTDSAQTNPSRKTILFFGNSLTAGYGLEPSQAFPALIQHKIDALKLPYQVVNAGLSGETSAGGLRRIDWLLNRKVDILVLELGANDGLRGIPLEDTRKNLQEIIARTKKKYPQAQVVIAGMMVPPNLGQTYTEQFRRLFIDLSKANKAALIPFLLDGVGGVPELNLPDGIHPTAKGHEKVAENVWRVLRPVLSKVEAKSQ